MTVKPNFFIVGAPKCGTTSMYTYLDQHPDVFMPEVKEPHHFADDMKSRGYLREPAGYYALFANAGSCSRVGEASVWYLYSETAAARIHAAIRSAKIIVMLRNPVDMLHSLHSQCLYSGQETIRDFEEAFEAESDRRAGHRWPNGEFENKLFYSAVGDYAPQIERYFRLFGRENVHVIFYDDFREQLLSEYQNCLRFLELDATFVPEFGVANANKKVHSTKLQRLIRRPSPRLRSWTRRIVPSPIRRAVISSATNWNRYYAPREPMSPATRERLQEQFREPIEVLSILLDRDLSHWCDSTKSAQPVRVA